MPVLPVVRYGESALSDVLPSVLCALGVAGEPNVLALDEARSVVVLVVDGLGHQLLLRNNDVAPFLSSLSGRSLTAGFPTTTATSLASLGTGVPPGAHGIAGYTCYLPELGESVNWLTWQTVNGARDLRERLPPELMQPRQTAFERAEGAGVNVTVVSGSQFRNSGLTRAVLRGGRYAGTVSAADAVVAAANAACRGRPGLVYCYASELDLVGHVRGSDSDAWRAQLCLIDRAAELLAARLPAGTRLLITADHGMVTVAEDDKLDYDATPELADGVATLAGEARARYLHVRPGAREDVLATWRGWLGERMWVLTREQAAAAGWFGPSSTPEATERIGDVLAVSRTGTCIVRRRNEPRLARLVGHHGALTDPELLVPLLDYTATG